MMRGRARARNSSRDQKRAAKTVKLENRDFTVRAEEQVGTIVFREGEITLDTDDSRAWCQTGTITDSQ